MPLRIPTREEQAELTAAAWNARANAHVPFSGFRVGAALLTADNRIFTGCNIEASNYSLTVCGERVALLKAMSEGAREFVAMAIAAESEEPTPPCGSCRQLLWENCGDLLLIASNQPGVAAQEWRLSDLLPHPFGASFFRH